MVSLPKCTRDEEKRRAVTSVHRTCTCYGCNLLVLENSYFIALNKKCYDMILGNIIKANVELKYCDL